MFLIQFWRYNSHTIQFAHSNYVIQSFNIFPKLCNQHHYLIPGHFHYLQEKPIFISSHSPSPATRLWQPLIYLMSLWICLFWTSHINGTVQHVAFCVHLLSHDTMFSRFTHFYKIYQYFILSWLNNVLLSGYTAFCLSSHQLTDVWVVSIFG